MPPTRTESEEKLGEIDSGKSTVRVSSAPAAQASFGGDSASVGVEATGQALETTCSTADRLGNDVRVKKETIEQILSGEQEMRNTPEPAKRKAADEDGEEGGQSPAKMPRIAVRRDLKMDDFEMEQLRQMSEGEPASMFQTVEGDANDDEDATMNGAQEQVEEESCEDENAAGDATEEAAEVVEEGREDLASGEASDDVASEASADSAQEVRDESSRSSADSATPAGRRTAVP